MKRTNCSGYERSSPKRSRMRSIVWASANSPASNTAGSPGARRTIMNTMINTPRAEGIEMRMRRSVYWKQVVTSQGAS
jgi:hypothetical protein